MTITIEITVQTRPPMGAMSAVPTSISRLERMTADEHETLFAYLRYVAANENVPEGALAEGLKRHFDVDNLPKLKRDQFTRAMALILQLVE